MIQTNTLIVSAVLSLLLFFMILQIRKMNKNRLMIYISEYKEGVVMNQTIRARIAPKKKRWWLLQWIINPKEAKTPPELAFFAMNDPGRKNPLDVNFKDSLPFLTITETMPIIGIRHILRLKTVYAPDLDATIQGRKEGKLREGEFYTYKKTRAWNLPSEFKSSLGLSDYLVSWAVEDKVADHEFCSYRTTSDFFRDVILPMGIIILAIIMIVLMPNILEKVNQMSAAQIDPALNSFKEMVKGFMPPG
jgi:hypothetical protein